jgi:hypothetical protein
VCRNKRQTEEGKGEEETVACVSYCTVPEPWFHDRQRCMQRTSAPPTGPKQTLLVGRLHAIRRQVSLRQLTLATESNHLRCWIPL